MENRFIIDCDCGCGAIEVEKFDDDAICISYMVPAFYAWQGGRWKERFRLIWSILRGKDYRLYEAVSTGSRFDEFKQWVVDLQPTRIVEE